MQRNNKEFWLSLVGIGLITITYALVTWQMKAFPAASGFFGHTIGVIGFMLMLMTEIIYSLRKRSRKARWGRMSAWLQFHIFTGIVGPYMVLLHTAWKFNGLAGAVLVLTVIIVISGFIGRYIYTAVPRTVDGAEMQSEELEQQIREAEAGLNRFIEVNPEFTRVTRPVLPDMPGSGWMAVLGRSLIEREYKARLRVEQKQVDKQAWSKVRVIEQLLKRKRILEHQVNSLATTRKLLSLWHTIHIPIGMALFTAAFIHVIAALYYATLLK